MLPPDSPLVGYVVERFVPDSDSLLDSEIRAHEAAGFHVAIFSLRPLEDRALRQRIDRDETDVTYVPSDGEQSRVFWTAIQESASHLPDLWKTLAGCADEDALVVYQAVLLARHATGRGITHLHAHSGGMAADVARVAARCLDIRYSFRARPQDLGRRRGDPQGLREKLAEAAAVISASDDVVDHIRAEYRDVLVPVRRIKDGLDLSALPYRPPTERPARVLAVGDLAEGKGFGGLMGACEMLAKAGRNFDCRIIGRGPAEDLLRSAIDRYGLRDRVRIVEPMRPEEMAEQIAQAAALLVPREEAGARERVTANLLVAMALGTPCITTDPDGLAGLIRHEETGLIVGTRSESLLAGEIERLLLQPSLREELARRARRMVESEFDVGHNTEFLRSVFYAAMPDDVPVPR